VKRTIAAAVFTLLTACGSINASGPNFTELSTKPLAENHARVYVFRDSVFYAMQASYIAKSQIFIDGQIIGWLANGGFVTTDISAGQHFITATSAGDPTTKYFNAVPATNIYIEIYDKTRMEGARAAAGAATGAIISKAQNANVADGAIKGAISGFYYSKNANEGRIWGMDYLSQEEALPKLQRLALSQ
jgi:hypothetical protein